MYALIQLRSQPTHRARIIAANNILNALFMIASSVIVGALLERRLHDSAGVPGHRPRSTRWSRSTSSCWCPSTCCASSPSSLTRFVYRFKVRGDENIPTEGAAILVCNHVSFVDAVLLMAASPRPIRFIMDHRIFKMPVLGWLFRLAKAIPIAPQQRRPGDLRAGLRARARRCCDDGDLLCIFPEGAITRDGELRRVQGRRDEAARTPTRCRWCRWRCRTCGARSSRASTARR